MASRRAAGARGESGQGLPYVLVVGVVLLVLLIAIVEGIVTEMRWLVGSQKRARVFQAADAGVDRGLYALLRPAAWEGLPILYYNADRVYTDIPGIKYTIKIQEGNWTPYSPAMGPETSYTPINVKTERTITVFASYTVTGERRKIQAIAAKSVLNSALYTEGVLSLGGSADIYWGPVVSYQSGPGSIDLTGQPACQVPARPIYISCGGITLGGSDAASVCGVSENNNAYAGLKVDAGNPAWCDPPPQQYTYWSDRAKAWDIKGTAGPAPKRYYFTGQANWAFTGFPNTKSGEWPNYMIDAGLDSTCVFFDVPDATAPYAVGSNEVTMKATGGCCGSGVLFVMGNLDMQGSGNCNNISAIPPTDCAKMGGPCTNPTTIKGAFWEGYIWVENTIYANGTKLVYGTVGARNGIGSGNFEIWFKSNNKTLAALGETVTIKYWRERKPENWDVFP